MSLIFYTWVFLNKYFCLNYVDQRVFQLEIIINVLVSFSRFI